MVPTSKVFITNLGSGKKLIATQLDVDAEITQSSNKCDDSTASRWKLINTPGVKHEYWIQNVDTGMVLGTAHKSDENKQSIMLRKINHDDHQKWRLIPVGTGKHEYAIMNVHSGRVLDPGDESKIDDAQIAQQEYRNEQHQRWRLTPYDADVNSRAVMTIVRNENVFLPIWLRYYGQFFSAHDIYVIDHQSNDGSTEGDGFVRIPVSHPEFGVGWQLEVIQRYQHTLVGRYDVVLYAEVDEIVAPDPRLGDLGSYIDHFSEDFVTCQGYEVLHRRDLEPEFDSTKPVLGQRSTWYANLLYSKSLLARVPMLWNVGFHRRLDRKTNHDLHLYLIHLHRMDYNICVARNHERTRFPLAHIDRSNSWGYQNHITDPTHFDSWFYHDSCGSSPIHPQPIPPRWRNLV